MLFSYRGLTSEYSYKRGTIEAESEIEAMKQIKENEEILVIINMKRISNVKSINKIREKLNVRLAKIENSINKRTKAYISKKDAKEKAKKMKSKKPQEKSIANKSPILRGINNLTSKLGKSKPSKPKQVMMDEELYANLQNMFKSQSDPKEIVQDYNIEFQQDDISENKIEKKEIPKKREKSTGKKIDWALLDNEDSEEVKDNKKIKVKDKEMLLFTRRLHIMLSSGMPLLSSLLSLQETSGKNLSKVLYGITEDIQMGTSFSEAISKYPRQFNYTYVALVSIGETSGSLEKSLKDILTVKEREQKIAKKIKVASMYPIAIGSVLILLMAGAFLFFIPSFEEVFVEQGIEMPVFSEIVFTIAGIFPLIIGAIVLLGVIFTLLRKNIPEVNLLYRRYVDKFFLKMPIIKKVNNASHMFSFSSTIALMLDNGIRLSDTLSLTGKTINNIYIKNEIEEIANLMVHGLTFSEAIKEQENFDEILANIALTGEKSGKMVFSLKQVSEYYEDELTRQIDSLLELVQPVSMLLIGLVLAPIIIAAYLPILEMSSGSGLF